MMETTVNGGMCRCCASEGLFKDVNTTYRWMGAEEVYAEMLHYCFDITLSTASDQNNGGICEVCITQLRNAANFKKQVLHTEEQFKRIQEQGVFKPEMVKVEMSLDDGTSLDNHISEDYQSGAEFDVPIKEESPEPKPKKRAAKATTSRAKKTKTESGEASTKRVRRLIKIETGNGKPVELKFVSKSKSRSSESLTEAKKNQHNLSIILLNSNANPIRCKDSLGYGCAFCPKQFPQPTKLKKHFMDEHNNDRLIKFMTSKLFENVVKLDITYLCCVLCDADFLQLDEFVEHLRSTHKKDLYADAKSQILPFRFNTPELRCAICSTEYATFKLLQEHMNTHFRNYPCKICGGCYVTERLLQGHLKRHGNGEYKCTQCDKTFTSIYKRREHVHRTHLGFNKRNKCQFCDERFLDYWKKIDHMVKVHGAPPVVLKCQACERTFNNQRALTRHKKKDHLLERRHNCSECEMKFFSSSCLRKHMAKHTGLRLYTCDVCHKSYGRKNTLREHMRIHADDRRFKCEHCGQAFVQKCSWRGHMRSKHGENV